MVPGCTQTGPGARTQLLVRPQKPVSKQHMHLHLSSGVTHDPVTCPASFFSTWGVGEGAFRVNPTQTKLISFMLCMLGILLL